MKKRNLNPKLKKAITIMLFAAVILLLIAAIIISSVLLDEYYLEEGEMETNGTLVVSTDWLVFEDESFVNYFNRTTTVVENPKKFKEVFCDLYKEGLILKTQGDLVEIPCRDNRIVLLAEYIADEGSSSSRTIYIIKGSDTVLYVTAPEN